jgi:hypothetical protein
MYVTHHVWKGTITGENQENQRRLPKSTPTSCQAKFMGIIAL